MLILGAVGLQIRLSGGLQIRLSSLTTHYSLFTIPTEQFRLRF